MDGHYHEGNACPVQITPLVTDIFSGARYLIGMGNEIDRLLKEFKRKKVSAAEIARRANVHATHLTEWRKVDGNRNIPDKSAIALARVLNTTPFDISPSFYKPLFDAIDDPGEREARRHDLRRTFRLQNIRPVDQEKAADSPPVDEPKAAVATPRRRKGR